MRAPDASESILLQGDEKAVFKNPELKHLAGGMPHYYYHILSHEVSFPNNPLSPPSFCDSGSVKKMNLFQSVNNAMSIALDTDESAGLSPIEHLL